MPNAELRVIPGAWGHFAGGGLNPADTKFIEGAQIAGLRTIWIDRGTRRGGEHRADHVVADITEAIAIMRDGCS
jgi:hypothetical protein